MAGKRPRASSICSTREGLIKGGEQGPAIVVGKPDDSRLVRLIRHLDEPKMPEDAPQLPAEAIEAISTWIANGAAYDKPLVDAAAVMTAKTVSDADRQFWSFRPLAEPAPPEVKRRDWCRGPIDQFVLEKLEAKGIVPNGPANRRKLIRRAYLDLLGLPPTPEQVEAFVFDESPDAYERLVDRLLENQHYGERWGRHWLDLALRREPRL